MIKMLNKRNNKMDNFIKTLKSIKKVEILQLKTEIFEIKNLKDKC